MRELGFQRAAVDLAGAEAGQRLGRDDDPLRDLEFGELAVEEAEQLGFAHASPFFAWMTATGTSPSRSSGTPNTATSATAGQA